MCFFSFFPFLFFFYSLYGPLPFNTSKTGKKQFSTMSKSEECLSDVGSFDSKISNRPRGASKARRWIVPGLLALGGGQHCNLPGCNNIRHLESLQREWDHGRGLKPSNLLMIWKKIIMKQPGPYHPNVAPYPLFPGQRHGPNLDLNTIIPPLLVSPRTPVSSTIGL